MEARGRVRLYSLYTCTKLKFALLNIPPTLWDFLVFFLKKAAVPVHITSCKCHNRHSAPFFFPCLSGPPLGQWSVLAHSCLPLGFRQASTAAGFHGPESSSRVSAWSLGILALATSPNPRLLRAWGGRAPALGVAGLSGSQWKQCFPNPPWLASCNGPCEMSCMRRAPSETSCQLHWPCSPPPTGMLLRDGTPFAQERLATDWPVVKRRRTTLLKNSQLPPHLLAGYPCFAMVCKNVGRYGFPYLL